MKLRILNKIDNCAVFCVNADSVLLARGVRLFERQNSGEHVSIARLPSSLARFFSSRARLLRQAMRLGLKSAIKLTDRTIICADRGAIYRWSPDGGVWSIVSLREGYHTPYCGLAGDSGGHIYYVEYALNKSRTKSMGIYRSDDEGKSFKLIYEKQAGEIRHFHSIQYDQYENCLWTSTGDLDSECGLYRSTDHGETWELVGAGSQSWRSVGLMFTPDYLYWGTDAGSDAGRSKNYIVRLARKNNKLEIIDELQGPCHGSTTLLDGTLLVATGVEGGKNEVDRKVHLWASRDGDKWQELISLKKDFWPFRIQYGVIRFPYGTNKNNILHFTTFGLSGCGETYFAARIENN